MESDAAAPPVHVLLIAPLGTIDLTLTVLRNSERDPASGAEAKRLADKLEAFRSFVASPDFTALAEYLSTSHPVRAAYIAPLIHGMASDALAELMLAERPIDRSNPLFQLAHVLRRLIRSVELYRVKGYRISTEGLDAIRRHIVSMNGSWVGFLPASPALPDAASATDAEIALHAIAAWAQREAQRDPAPWHLYAQVLALRSIVSLEATIQGARIAFEEAEPSPNAVNSRSLALAADRAERPRRRAKKGAAAASVERALKELATRFGYESVTAQRVADHLNIPKSTVTQQDVWKSFSNQKRAILKDEPRGKHKFKRRSRSLDRDVDERENVLRELSNEADEADEDQRDPQE